MIDALGSPQSALVLGGASDIAVATLRRMVALRCSTVVLAGRDRPRMDAAAEELRSLGAARVAVEDFDCLEVTSHAKVIDAVFEHYGDLDVVIAAAGRLGDQRRDELDPEATARLIATNFGGLASALLAVADRLRRQGHGKIVVLSSVAGERPRRANFIYGSSKAGLDAFARGLSDSLEETGIGVVIVRPGFVHSRMTLGREAAPGSTTPEAVAEQIMRALRTGARSVWVPPYLRWVMLALRHLPAPVWRKIGS